MSACIVLTRAHEDNRSLKARLQKNSFIVHESPCLQIRYQSPTLAEEEIFFSFLKNNKRKNAPLQALFFVPSRHAWWGWMAWLKQEKQQKKILTNLFLDSSFTTVGTKTTRLLQKEQKEILHQNDYAHDLSLWIAENISPQKFFLLKPRGNLSRTSGEYILQEKGFIILSLTLYQNQEINPLPLVHTDCPFPQGVVFYSPSAVRRFFQANPPSYFAAKPVPDFFCLGATTAQELKKFSFTPLVPAEPNEESMSHLIENTCKNTCRGKPENKNLQMSANQNANKRSYAKSHELFQQACKIIPGGVNSPVRAFASVEGEAIFIESGQGSQVTDADGNTYIDYCCSWGPLILGHSHPQVAQACSQALQSGLTFGTCHSREVELASLVLEAFPEFEQARFVSSGTEAVMTAIRLARGISGRSKILKFDGCYHGHADSLLVKAGSGLITQPIASSLGVPPQVAEQTLVAPLGDSAAVEELFSRYKDEIACVIIEPLPANSGLLQQSPEFLNFLRDITARENALLIFDEVISGLRLRFGGYAHEVGVMPDIITLGKIVGGGMPVGALLSTKENMSKLAPLGNIYQAGTLSGNPVAMAAGIATLKVLREQETYQKLEELGQALEDEFLALRKTFPFFQNRRVGSLVWLYLAEGEIPTRPDQVNPQAVQRFAAAHRKMLDRGIYLAPSAWEVSFLSLAHTKEDIAKTAAAWQEVLPQLV